MTGIRIITFRVSRRRREVYIGHARLSVCLSVRGRMPTLLHTVHRLGCNVGNGRGCPLVMQYWADLQSVHGLRCYDNIARTRNVSERLSCICSCDWLYDTIRYIYVRPKANKRPP